VGFTKSSYNVANVSYLNLPSTGFFACIYFKKNPKSEEKKAGEKNGKI
jgi:hypothetical protein